MAGWTLLVALFLYLPLTVSSDADVTVVKTLRNKPDFTPLCKNETQSVIILLTCRIRTESRRGNHCDLLYHIEKGFEHHCDSRFRLMTENQTVFLYLNNLTSGDSGDYNCECVNLNGIFIFRFNVTVEDSEDSEENVLNVLRVLISVTLVVVITGVVLGLVYRTIHHRNGSRSTTSVYETSSPVNQENPDDVYTNLQRPTSNLYQTVSSVHRQHDCVDEGDTDSCCDVYENP